MKKIFLLLPLLLLSGCVTNERTILVESDRPWSAVRIYQEAAPAVATVLSSDGTTISGQGSGFLINGGYLVTNAHVVLIDDKRAREVFVEWNTGNRTEAAIVRTDLNTDLAVLRTTVPNRAEPLQLSPRDELFPGEPVAAIGSPFGEGQSLSTGIISATDRSVQSLNEFAIEDAIQTDASINPGNSGGPLLDARGRVIGINQQIQTQSGGNDGVGYAVPVSALQRILQTLQENKPLRYPYLGVSLQEVWPELARHLQLPEGVLLIGEVVPGGPAEKAGLRGGIREEVFQGAPVRSGGDAIFSLDGERMKSSSDLQAVLLRSEPGDRLPLVVIRDGKRQKLEIVLGERPRK